MNHWIKKKSPIWHLKLDCQRQCQSTSHLPIIESRLLSLLAIRRPFWVLDIFLIKNPKIHTISLNSHSEGQRQYESTPRLPIIKSSDFGGHMAAILKFYPFSSKMNHRIYKISPISPLDCQRQCESTPDLPIIKSI